MTTSQKSLLFTALAGLLAFLFAGCGRDMSWAAVDRMIAADHPGATPISTDSLARRLDARAKPRPLLLDVRETEEYDVSHLPGAHRLAPDARPDSALPPVLEGVARNTPIVTYCSVGYRSAAMAERLQAAGFTNVTNLDGSIFRWANEGRPVYRGGERVRAVHPYGTLWGRLLTDSLHARTPAP